MVVRQGFSSKQSVAEAIRHLKFLETKVLGFVLTGADVQYKRYKKYWQKYGYGYGYEDADADASRHVERPKTTHRCDGQTAADEK